MLNYLKSGIVALVAFISLPLSGTAQEAWDLRKCVLYAVENNISVKQSEIQERVAALTHQQSRDARWGQYTGSMNGGEQFGRNIDPTTNQFTSNRVGFLSAGLQGGASLFNWFSQRNTIESNRLAQEASIMATENLKEDIALNVAAAYLQAVNARQQMNLSEVQISQTTDQLRSTRLQVEAGSLPELNSAQLEAQLALDSSIYIQNESSFHIAILQLKALLTLPADYPFTIQVPRPEEFRLTSLGDLIPEEVFAMAINNRPGLQATKYQRESAVFQAKATKASMYPTFSVFGNANTAYSTSLKQLPHGDNIVTVVPTQAYVQVGSEKMVVYSPVSMPSEFLKANIFRQFNNNFRQSVGLGLSIPIFSGHSARTQYRRALMNVENIELTMKQDTLTLKQDIYTAYQNAINAFSRLNSRRKAVETAEYAYNLGRQRYDIGLLPVFELITLQNNLRNVQIEMLRDQFEFIFRTKILEFYRGTGITL